MQGRQALYVRAAPSVGLVDGLDEKTGEQLARHSRLQRRRRVHVIYDVIYDLYCWFDGFRLPKVVLHYMQASV